MCIYVSIVSPPAQHLYSARLVYCIGTPCTCIAQDWYVMFEPSVRVWHYTGMLYFDRLYVLYR